MKSQKILASLVIATLAIFVLLILTTDAPGRVWAGEPAAAPARSSARASAATGVVTSAFSFQGLLKENGEPASGDREMHFGLYADAQCTVDAATPLTHTVPVSEGVFSAYLSFDPAAFDGRALWLKTTVATTTLGCQPIQSVPYASGLRPGAVISASVSSDGNLFHARSGMESGDQGVMGARLAHRTGLGYPVGVYAYAYEYGSVGVWGVSDSQYGWGVNGIAEGEDSIGVRGIAAAISTTTYGVYGEGASSGGYGGYFANTAGDGAGWALAAEARHGAIITSSGGTALRASGSGDSAIGDDGVNGIHTGDGVVGESTSTGNLDNGVVGFSAGGYGVYGFSNGTGQYGGYFDDPISVNGGCTGCTLRYVARNTGGGTLRAGDVVRAAGVDARLAGEQTPVIQVQRATAGDAVLGVVVGRTELFIAEAGTHDVQPGAHYGPVGGPAEPGDYLVIVVQGMAQVRLDPAAEAQMGDSLEAGADGATKASSTAAFGTLLDVIDADGLAWVLVGLD